MSNIIRLNETSPNTEWLVMSNQGTDCFLDLLICAAEAMEQTAHQRELVCFLKDQKEINENAPGNAGFDLAEMPWQKETLTEDVRFLIHAAEQAESEEVCARLPYEISRDIVMPWLSQFAELAEHILYPMIRKAASEDVPRIAEILVFTKRMHYRSIFHNDAYSFNELQVLSEAKKYADPAVLDRMLIYDDGIVKGLIHIENNEIRELYVDSFFQDQGIGSALIEYVKEQYPISFLWVLEKNKDAVRFYEAHGFHLTDTRKLEEGTTEYIVMMER
ncbi:MAG: GNAT family N-acetyltransferase [Solobacterium sp.]|nr:GNAT family N-acetyltransferase [Solobacterium sp.]